MKSIAVLALVMAIAGTVPLTHAQSPAPGSAQPGGRQAKVDTNGDGVIDRKEAAVHPKLAEHFDRMDKNKDGRIDASERPQRQGKGQGGRQGERGERMAKLDANGDGRFSRDELAGRDRMLQNFGAIDTNKDGVLTREEMRAHHQSQRGMKRGEAR